MITDTDDCGWVEVGAHIGAICLLGLSAGVGIGIVIVVANGALEVASWAYGMVVAWL